MINLKGRNLLTLLDFSTREIEYLLDLSRDLKRAKYAGNEQENLKGKNIVILFQKTSTRTRCAFEVAALDQGAHVTYIGAEGSQMGIKESIADTARVLGRMYDAIEFRCMKQSDCDELAKYAGVPVYNGLSELYHPTQMIADYMTMREKFGQDLKGIKVVFFGDARNNVANSLMICGAKLGVHFVACGPKKLWPNETIINKCKEIAKETGAKLEFVEDPLTAAKGAHVIYTDIWVSMGEPKEVWEERIKLLKPYQVNKKLFEVADKEAIFMHCLPSYHDLNTNIGKEIHEKFGLKEMEVTNDVFESKRSWVFEEAENRLHSIKAIMVATIGK
ncbi:ornithine carbamoyltransferase [Spiroplasma endosymbiont of Crioceris asparagi]|uniref:ornithine carbamoyltransferase n=1 Tax=Spiroplasma endosymbiont of Crioceris asparagi TaxID=3066286 RepID=UPI0030D00AB6